jgi:hypothetical protein
MHMATSRVRFCFGLGVAVLCLGLGEAWADVDHEPVEAAAERPRACADDGSVQAAAEHFTHGYELAQQGDYGGALQEFNAAYATCPNFAVLYNIGQALIELHRPLEAVATLSRYLQEGQAQIAPERIGQVNDQIRMLKAFLGDLEVTTKPPGALISVDGTAIGRTPLAGPIPLAPGVHVISATLDDGRSAEVSQTIDQGKRHVIVLQLPPPPKEKAPVVIRVLPPPPPPSQPGRLRKALPYAFVGAGVALAGAAVGAYVWERQAYGKWQDAQPAVHESQPGSPDYARAAEESNRLAASVTTAKHTLWGLAIGSGALITTGISLYLFYRSSKGRSATPTIAWSGGTSFTTGWRYSW